MVPSCLLPGPGVRVGVVSRVQGPDGRKWVRSMDSGLIRLHVKRVHTGKSFAVSRD